MEVEIQEETVSSNQRRSRRKCVKNGVSKIFLVLMKCLCEKTHQHMLRFADAEKTEFEVKLTDKKSPKWRRSCISLFEDMDMALPRKESKSKQHDYDVVCKNRAKANLCKLCKSGYLELCDTRKSLPYTYMTYRILKDPECYKKGKVVSESEKGKVPKKSRKFSEHAMKHSIHVATSTNRNTASLINGAEVMEQEINKNAKTGDMCKSYTAISLAPWVPQCLSLENFANSQLFGSMDSEELPQQVSQDFNGNTVNNWTVGLNGDDAINLAVPVFAANGLNLYYYNTSEDIFQGKLPNFSDTFTEKNPHQNIFTEQYKDIYQMNNYYPYPEDDNKLLKDNDPMFSIVNLKTNEEAMPSDALHGENDYSWLEEFASVQIN